MDKILVAGIPRSGTTWLANVLSKCEGYKYIHEPDNERPIYTGFYYKRGLRRFPFIHENEEHSNYYNLFNNAFYGSHISMGSHFNELLFKLGGINKNKIEHWLQKEHKIPNKKCPEYSLYKILPKDVVKADKKRIVKTVHATLSLPFLLKKFNVPVLIIIRHPASVISSYLKMNNPDINRKIFLNKKLIDKKFANDFPNIDNIHENIIEAGLQVSMFYKIIFSIQNLPNVTIIRHEDLCLDPIDGFKSIMNRYSLPWNKNIEDYIIQNNLQGEGYNIQRVAAENVDIWKKRLNNNQIEKISEGYNLIKTHFYTDF